jgi:DUF1680 family protein
MLIRIPLLFLMAAAILPVSLTAQTPPAPRAELFPLNDVRLLESPFRLAMKTDHDYLLQLEPDRLLAWFRKEAGLEPKAQNYPGWENRGIAGHSLGHYLSALSLMWQATGDERLRERVNYIADELAACQQANGNGYVGAIPNGKKMFAEIAAGDIRPNPGFNLNGGWVPWYTMHKIFAGLIDAHERCGNEKARDVAVKLTDWCGGVVEKLDDGQMQKMLSVEQGGMAESLAEISAIAKEPRYLALAKKFRHARVFDPLAEGKDALSNLHANTQIPKVIGYERIYELTGDPAYGKVARNFWNFVVHDRSFANGGHGVSEHFFPPATIREAMLKPMGPETCNTYNMLKLTEHLFCEQPNAELTDFYERALYNHILATQTPGEPGSLVYYTPMRAGAYRSDAHPFEDFWCCVGSGMENHAKYGQMIYAKAGEEKLFVNLFIPSEVKWNGGTLRQETKFPLENQTRLTFTLPEPKTFAVAVRYPGWAGAGELKASVNGESALPASAKPGEYFEIQREWKNGDALTLELPMKLHTEPLPQADDFAAVFSGPILLAANLGHDGMSDADFHRQIINEAKVLPAAKAPVFLAAEGEITSHLQAVPDAPLTFRTRDLAKPSEVTLQPFYTIGHDRYALYWKLTSADKYAEQLRAQETLEEKDRVLAARTIDRVIPGEQQPEVDHALKSEKSQPAYFRDRPLRDAAEGGWFSYELKTPPDRPVKLLCNYWGGETLRRKFDILVDGKTLATQTLNNERPGEFYDVEYPLPAELTRGKEKVTVKFQPAEKSRAGGVFDVRIVE